MANVDPSYSARLIRAKLKRGVQNVLCAKSGCAAASTLERSSSATAVGVISRTTA